MTSVLFDENMHHRRVPNMINYICFERNCSPLMESDSPCIKKERRPLYVNSFPLGCCDHNDTIVCHVQFAIGQKAQLSPLRVHEALFL